MKKITTLLTALLLVCSLCLAAQAEELTVSTLVPGHHNVAVEASGGRVIADNQLCGATVAVERQKEQTWQLVPNQGKILSALYYNGENVTDQMKGTTFTAPSITEDAKLKAVFVNVPRQEDHFDLEGTVTDSEGSPIPGATVDIGGYTGTTDENGEFRIEDIPPGTYPVVITDKDGAIIGTGEITIGKPGEGALTVTTDENGSPVIIPGKNTDKIGMTLTLEKDGTVTLADVKDITPGKPVKSTHTGDDTAIISWLCLIAAAVACLALCIVPRRKKKP